MLPSNQACLSTCLIKLKDTKGRPLLNTVHQANRKIFSVDSYLAIAHFILDSIHHITEFNFGFCSCLEGTFRIDEEIFLANGNEEEL